MKNKSELANGLNAVASHFNNIGIEWCIFGSVAACCYGAERAVTDVDILVGEYDPDALVKMCPFGIERKKGVIDYDDFEIRSAPLNIKTTSGNYVWSFDKESVERRQKLVVYGVLSFVLSPEDIFVIKSISQRGPEIGKYDLADIAAMWKHNSKWDMSYLKRRAELCSAWDRVQQCMDSLEKG